MSESVTPGAEDPGSPYARSEVQTPEDRAEDEVSTSTSSSPVVKDAQLERLEEDKKDKGSFLKRTLLKTKDVKKKDGEPKRLSAVAGKHGLAKMGKMFHTGDKGANKGEMPEPEQLAKEYEAFLVSAGLEKERAQYDSLSAEAKWKLIQDFVEASTKPKSGSRKAPSVGHLVEKLRDDPSPKHVEAVRAFLEADHSSVTAFTEAGGPAALMTTISTFEDKNLKGSVAGVVECARLLALKEHGAEALLEASAPVVLVGLFHPKYGTPMRLATILVMNALAESSSAGCRAVVEAWTMYGKSCNERGRFEHLVQAVRTDGGFDVSGRLAVASLLTTMVVRCEDRATRVKLRTDMAQQGFKTLLVEYSDASKGDKASAFGEVLQTFRQSQLGDEAAEGAANDGKRSNRNSLPVPGGTPWDPLQALLPGMEGNALLVERATALASSLASFGTDKSSMWKWQAAARLTRMIASFPVSLEGAASEATSPEAQLFGLLLGGAVQDQFWELRHEVHEARVKLQLTTEAASLTIRDLQAQLDETKRKLAARKTAKSRNTLAKDLKAAAQEQKRTSGVAETTPKMQHKGSPVSAMQESPQPPDDDSSSSHAGSEPHLLEKSRGGRAPPSKLSVPKSIPSFERGATPPPEDSEPDHPPSSIADDHAPSEKRVSRRRVVVAAGLAPTPDDSLGEPDSPALGIAPSDEHAAEKRNRRRHGTAKKKKKKPVDDLTASGAALETSSITSVEMHASSPVAETAAAASPGNNSPADQGKTSDGESSTD